MVSLGVLGCVFCLCKGAPPATYPGLPEPHTLALQGNLEPPINLREQSLKSSPLGIGWEEAGAVDSSWSRHSAFGGFRVAASNRGRLSSAGCFGIYASAGFHAHGFPNVDPEERGGTKIHYLYLQPVALDLIRKLVSKHHAQQHAARRLNRKQDNQT